VDVAREALGVREGLSAAWLMRRDAPGVLWEQTVGYIAGLLCDWGMCRSGGEVRLSCEAEEHAEEQAEELPQGCQISVKLAGQRLDTTCPPRLYSGRWRSPLLTLGVLLRGRGSYERDDRRNRFVR
jgi:hypothetical protein